MRVTHIVGLMVVTFVIDATCLSSNSAFPANRAGVTGTDYLQPAAREENGFEPAADTLSRVYRSTANRGTSNLVQIRQIRETNEEPIPSLMTFVRGSKSYLRADIPIKFIANALGSIVSMSQLVPALESSEAFKNIKPVSIEDAPLTDDYVDVDLKSVPNARRFPFAEKADDNKVMRIVFPFISQAASSEIVQSLLQVIAGS